MAGEISGNVSSLTLEEMGKSKNPMDFYRQYVAERLAPIVSRPAAELIPLIQWTTTLDKGDLMLAAAALRVKGKPPQELAKEIVEAFPSAEETLVTVSQAGPFVQFFAKPEHLISLTIPEILTHTRAYGCNPTPGLKEPSDPSKGRKKIIVEFSSPNIAKEFHAGHLRSTIIGGFLAKLYQRMGWDVIKMNYLGDWGKQYGLLANGFKQFGSQEELDKNSIAHLFQVYVQINKVKEAQDEPINELKKEIKEKKDKGEDVSALEAKLAPLVDASEDEKARKYFKSMEDGDPEALALWQKFRDMSIQKYQNTYARLNIEFDVYSGESQVKAKTIKQVLDSLLAQGIAEYSDGAILIDFAKHGAKKLNKAIIVRKDGTPLYLTRDLAAILERHDQYQFDKMIYVVADQQNEHLAQLFKTTEISGHKDVAEKCEHISFGMVKGMSTRKGTVKFLDDIIQTVKDTMLEVMKKNDQKYAQLDDPDAVADVLAITAIMVQDLTGKVRNGYEFNINQMTAFEGDTGPYLQYAHARLCSIERKANADLTALGSADLSLLKESHAINLARSLAQFPDVVLNTLKTREPATVLTYLFKMAHALSSSYDHLQVVGSERELQKARLALYEAARQVLWNGMTLLGLTPVERM
ncbi:arginine-tRNA ligase [Cladophialophora bantiana CBS 173.52]|uniref:arginine--tRNA ligase n=1 Tax=Cladophialophora bantiana (strain ATCC 10958 / CBS 173.52 / CDC B-1940 / NIH 8579) TaxID=1442370 RepID=A0A0D2HR62_CLAB1|nr:arginine-tRNA ligase [Cladophialophora bantiana CBS 173.52]KIW93335.1 arginine-tRNA ligase [Cladophialophora bantiana CBS 173.52]